MCVGRVGRAVIGGGRRARIGGRGGRGFGGGNIAAVVIAIIVAIVIFLLLLFLYSRYKARKRNKQQAHGGAHQPNQRPNKRPNQPHKSDQAGAYDTYGNAAPANDPTGSGTYQQGGVNVEDKYGAAPASKPEYGSGIDGGADARPSDARADGKPGSPDATPGPHYPVASGGAANAGGAGAAGYPSPAYPAAAPPQNVSLYPPARDGHDAQGSYPAV